MTQTVLITGANRGIGLALAQLFLNRGCEIIALCRKSSIALRELDKCTIIEDIDVSRSASIAAAAKACADRHIDILINNAGILRNEILGMLDYASIEEQFAVNTLGPLKVTEAFLPLMSEGGKVIMITSRMGSIEDNTSGGRYGYRMAKCALNAAAKSLSHDLEPAGIAVAVLHPGYVQTAMVNNTGEISAAEAAEGLAARIDDLTMDNTGGFWHAKGQRLPW